VKKKTCLSSVSDPHPQDGAWGTPKCACFRCASLFCSFLFLLLSMPYLHCASWDVLCVQDTYMWCFQPRTHFWAKIVRAGRFIPRNRCVMMNCCACVSASSSGGTFATGQLAVCADCKFTQQPKNMRITPVMGTVSTCFPVFFGRFICTI